MAQDSSKRPASPPFRDLRHTSATPLLLKVRPKVVQSRLVHTKISTTISIDSHVLAGTDDTAANGLPDAPKSPAADSDP